MNKEGRSCISVQWMLVGCIRKPFLFLYRIIMGDLLHMIPPHSLIFRHHTDAMPNDTDYEVITGRRTFKESDCFPEQLLWVP